MMWPVTRGHRGDEEKGGGVGGEGLVADDNKIKGVGDKEIQDVGEEGKPSEGRGFDLWTENLAMERGLVRRPSRIGLNQRADGGGGGSPAATGRIPGKGSEVPSSLVLPIGGRFRRKKKPSNPPPPHQKTWLTGRNEWHI